MNKLLFITKSIFQHPYNRQHPTSALFRSLIWYILKNSAVKIYKRRFWGIQFYLWLESNQSMWLNRNYIMDWDEFHFIKRYLKQEDCAIDLGANIGIYSLWISKFILAPGQIFAIEPDHLNYDRLNSLIELNKIKNIRAYQTAIYETTGPIHFSSDLDGQNHVLYANEKQIGSVEVPALTFDDFCIQESITHIDYLKVDIEGGELYFLRGAEKYLSEQNIDVIQIEVNKQIENYGINPDEIIKLIRKHHYKFYIYEASKNKLEEVPSSEINYNDHKNYLLIHDIEKVRNRIKCL